MSITLIIMIVAHYFSFSFSCLLLWATQFIVNILDWCNLVNYDKWGKKMSSLTSYKNFHLSSNYETWNDNMHDSQLPMGRDKISFNPIVNIVSGVSSISHILSPKCRNSYLPNIAQSMPSQFNKLIKKNCIFDDRFVHTNGMCVKLSLFRQSFNHS